MSYLRKFSSKRSSSSLNQLKDICHKMLAIEYLLSKKKPIEDTIHILESIVPGAEKKIHETVIPMMQKEKYNINKQKLEDIYRLATTNFTIMWFKENAEKCGKYKQTIHRQGKVDNDLKKISSRSIR